MKKTAFILTVLLLASLILTIGCNSKPKTNPFIGTWKSEELNEIDKETNIIRQFTFLTVTETRADWKSVYANKYYPPDSSPSTPWTVSNLSDWTANSLTITENSQTATLTVTWNNSGKTSFTNQDGIRYDKVIPPTADNPFIGTWRTFNFQTEKPASWGNTYKDKYLFFIFTQTQASLKLEYADGTSVTENPVNYTISGGLYDSPEITLDVGTSPLIWNITWNDPITFTSFLIEDGDIIYHKIE